MEDLEVIEAMQKYGGGFASALATAASRADSDNLSRIKKTWPELWKKYGAFAKQDARLLAEIQDKQARSA